MERILKATTFQCALQMIQNHKVRNLEFGLLLMAQKEHGLTHQTKVADGQVKIRTNLELGNSMQTPLRPEPGWMTLATSMELLKRIMVIHT